jgi:copper(I)-binding protein
MSIQSYGRVVTATAIFFLSFLFLCASAHAQTYRAGDVSISAVNGRPTPPSADIAHVSFVIANTGVESDVLLSAEVPRQIAQAAGFDALPVQVYRGASLRRTQPVFIAAGQIRALGLDDLHLVLYGIQGPFERGMQIPVRLAFQKAGAVDVIVDVGGQTLEASTSAPPAKPGLALAQYRRSPMATGQENTEPGHAFKCSDGSKLTLTFAAAEDRLNAVVQLKGETFSLPNQPPEAGPVQIVWSDGDHSLTWSPGVQLMWMTSTSHLMCGRGGHQH